MTSRVITLLIFAFLLGCKSESVSTKSTETAASMKEAFVKLIEAESPTHEIQIIEAKVVGELGVIFADLHPGSGRKPATVYMHFNDGRWTHVKRVDVWSNNPRYLFPRINIPEDLHSYADEIDSWVLKKIGGDVSGMWLAEQKIMKSEQGGADQPATALESKPEGKEKPKPESEVRSQ